MPSKKGPTGRRGPPPKGKGGKPKGKKRGFGAAKFQNSRTADIEDLEDEVSDDVVSPSEDELLEDDDVQSEDDDVQSEDDQSAKRPYLALLQSLSKDTAPRAKKRKLAHQSQESRPKSGVEPEPEPASEDEDRDVDKVEEPEEGAEDEVEIDAYDDDDEEDSSDPFETHFAKPDQDVLKQRLKAVESKNYAQTQSEKNGWKIIRNTPGKDSTEAKEPPTTSGPSGLKLKHRLVETANKQRPTFDQLEQVLYPLVFGYQDLLFCGRTVKNAENLRRMACLHAVNHVFKTRDRVIKNNAKLAREGEETDFEPRDQGFTRPKVLMILPTRQSAVNVVNTICALCEPDQQENRKRFDDSYVDREAKFTTDRPEDFRELFEGNDDDMFRIGIKFTRKSIKYFAQFYNSDVILASPLGLRMAIGSGSTAEDRKDKKKGQQADYDFLSSIEVVVVDQADALLMQNWEHVEHVFAHLNLQPREAHGCDFSRVREWYLDRQAARFRQTVILSAFNTPELAELHRSGGSDGGGNWAGRARVQPAEYPGAIQELGVRARQTFSRFEAPSVADDPDARFEYFTSAVLPALTKRAGGGVSASAAAAGSLVFIPSYLDFVRVRNYLAAGSASALTFGVVSEYTDVAGASRARSHFQNGRQAVLLYTERAHHFRRYALRGVRRVVFYGLPDNPTFYREVAGGFLARGSADATAGETAAATPPTVRAMFSRYDALKLERIVGTRRVGRMLREKGDTFDFV